ncbi:MAG: DUF4097 family beta strand repeat-containing protein [Verrucomicrobiota bacterium]
MKVTQTCLHTLATTLFVAALFFEATQPSVASTEDRIKKSFPVSAGGKLKMEVDRGSIEVKENERGTLDVEVIRRIERGSTEKAREILKDHEIEFAQEGNEVQIKARLRDSVASFWRRRDWNLNVRYLVFLPRQFNLDLTTSGGSISVGGLEGEVRCRTSGGSISLGRMQGPVWARTSGGNIAVKGCKSAIDVQTSGGNVRLGEVAGSVTARTSGGSISIGNVAGHITATTSGGSIDVAEVLGGIEASTSGGSVRACFGKQPEGGCSLKTSGGNIDVKLANSIALDLDAHTSGGRVITDLPVTVQGELWKTELKGKLNDGGPVLLLRTSGGNVHIRRM